MFEENNKDMIEQDLLFRAILEEGQEPAPAHVWDRIEEDLDRIAQRRRAVLWFRRTAVGVAAAAVLALGLFFDWGGSDDIVSPVANEGMIAVVEQKTEIGTEENSQPSEIRKASGLMAMVAKSNAKKSSEYQQIATPETISETAISQEEKQTEESPSRDRKDSRKNTRTPGHDQEERFPDFWPEDETAGRKGGMSFTVSGITGTNSAQNSNRVNPMRRPGISAAPQKTGIKETSTNTTYSIPVSVGAGVKFDIAPRWSIGAGLNYTLLTRKFYGTYTQIGKDGSILRDVSSDIRETQHYIGIPVNVYYDIINRDHVNFYAYAGAAVEKCIADKYQVLSTSINHTEKVKGMQFSADLGMGVEFMVARYLGIYLDPSIRYYFESNQPKSIRTAQPLMFGFEMGLRFRL